MTDQTLTDEVRKIVNDMRSHADHDAVRGREEEYVRHFAGLLDALLPSPPRPTMADMTMEERYACRWMQCDVRNAKITHGVIANNHGGNTHILDAEGEVWYLPPTDITPRPDLPRLEWPGDEKPAPAPALPDGWRLAEHPDHGRVIVTNTRPDVDGRVYVVLPAADRMGYDWLFCDLDELTYLAQGDDTSDAVPPPTLTEGSVWKNANALTQACSESGRDQIAVIDKNGEVGVWDSELRGWRTYAPGPVFAPYTIIHTGRKADQ